VEKAPDAFRTISEVAADLAIPQHVLRFWESRFREIRPMKRGGGRRYYRPDDVSLVRGIRHLLYGEGYTIRGVQRILREQGVKFVQSIWQPGAPQPSHRSIDESDFTSDEAEARRADAEEAARGRGLFSLLPSLLGDQQGHDAQRAATERPEVPPLPSRKVVPPAPPMGGGLRRDDFRRLQAALAELSECRRLLDGALAHQA